MDTLSPVFQTLLRVIPDFSLIPITFRFNLRPSHPSFSPRGRAAWMESYSLTERYEFTNRIYYSCCWAFFLLLLGQWFSCSSEGDTLLYRSSGITFQACSILHGLRPFLHSHCKIRTMVIALPILNKLKNNRKNTAEVNTYIRIGWRYLALRPSIYSRERNPGLKSRSFTVSKKLLSKWVIS